MLLERKLEGQDSILELRRAGFRLLARLRQGAGAMALGLVLLANPGVAYAQGCAMCKASAAALKDDALKALESGIIILMIPPVLIFVGLITLAFRRANTFNEPEVPDGAPEGGFDLNFPNVLPRLDARIDAERRRYP